MPVAALKSLAAKAGASLSRAEKLWKKAKGIAADAGRANDYGYITGILKRSLGLHDSRKESLQDLELLTLGWPIDFVLAPRAEGYVGLMADQLGESSDSDDGEEDSLILTKLFLGKVIKEMTGSAGAGAFLGPMATVMPAMAGKSEDDVMAQLQKMFPGAELSYLKHLLRGRKK